ncbi:hypothetical protein E2C01_031769 [Portunus trituberculatus]|uniref:Uncharacterized protein n=1 Tax=Portunus trituberculatus TaxID=210409 RepID=A0A5B7EVL5_PORTR|nr:hypothetical protein [Portunus trituberculatus]
MGRVCLLSPNPPRILQLCLAFHLQRDAAEVKMAALTSRFVYVSRKRSDIVERIKSGVYSSRLFTQNGSPINCIFVMWSLPQPPPPTITFDFLPFLLLVRCGGFMMADLGVLDAGALAICPGTVLPHPSVPGVLLHLSPESVPSGSRPSFPLPPLQSLHLRRTRRSGSFLVAYSLVPTCGMAVPDAGPNLVALTLSYRRLHPSLFLLLRPLLRRMLLSERLLLLSRRVSTLAERMDSVTARLNKLCELFPSPGQSSTSRTSSHTYQSPPAKRHVRH